METNLIFFKLCDSNRFKLRSNILYPFIFMLIQGWAGRRQLSEQRCQDFLIHTQLQLFLEDPEVFPALGHTLSACPYPEPNPSGMSMEYLPRETPGGIRNRCSLLSKWGSSSSTLSSFWVTDPHPIPTTHGREVIWTSYVHDLVLSVMTQTSWPGVTIPSFLISKSDRGIEEILKVFLPSPNNVLSPHQIPILTVNKVSTKNFKRQWSWNACMVDLRVAAWKVLKSMRYLLT